MDTDKSPIYKPSNEVYEGKGGRLYSGCFINMQVEFWAQDNKTGRVCVPRCSASSACATVTLRWRRRPERRRLRRDRRGRRR